MRRNRNEKVRVQVKYQKLSRKCKRIGWQGRVMRGGEECARRVPRKRILSNFEMEKGGEKEEDHKIPCERKII